MPLNQWFTSERDTSRASKLAYGRGDLGVGPAALERFGPRTPSFPRIHGANIAPRWISGGAGCCNDAREVDTLCITMPRKSLTPLARPAARVTKRVIARPAPHEELRRLRLAQQLSRAQLAHDLGVSVGYIGHCERGIRLLGWVSARRAAELYGWPIESICPHVFAPATQEQCAKSGAPALCHVPDRA